MVSALVCIITHCTRPIMSHNVRLLGNHNFTKLLFYIISQPWEYWFYAKVNKDTIDGSQ